VEDLTEDLNLLLRNAQPDYYEEVKNPISLNIIMRHLKVCILSLIAIQGIHKVMAVKVQSLLEILL